jgi:arylsulfatase A-like enzyme
MQWLHRAPRAAIRPLLIALASLGLLIGSEPAGAAERPNLVFVLADDLSSDLVRYMRHVQALQRDGTSFDRYVVTDSLCCPSRASIFTGRYPHSTGVIRNQPPDGGFAVFHPVAEQSTFATSLTAAGYRTALMGKYLNGYSPRGVVDGRPRYVPPGWSDWAVAGEAYEEFDYDLLVASPGAAPRVVRHGRRARDYLTDVISRRGRRFIADAVRSGHPFMLELAPFAPHDPYTPAPRDRGRFPNAAAPRGALFNAPQLEGAPSWLPQRPLTVKEIERLDRNFRKRVQSVQAIDRMLGAVQRLLRRLRVARNTYVIFSSDNGFHMGQRRLMEGKQGAWDHDIRVPLVIAGPGVPSGATISQLTANVDLRPTFEQLAGVPVAGEVEGRSLVGLLRTGFAPSWRDVTVIEHHGPLSRGDPDRQDHLAGKPPSYKALRFADALYVAYDNPRRPPEYYDLNADPDERRNVFGSLSPDRQQQLGTRLAALGSCVGVTCLTADSG